jgi:uncharacterized protein DUF4328
MLNLTGRVQIESLRGRSRAAVAFLALNGVLLVADLVYHVVLRVTADRAAAGSAIGDSAWQWLQGVETLIGVLLLASALGAAITFLRWLHLLYQNLSASRIVGLDYGASAAVWSFFIPFVNLVRPYRVMREAWRASAAIAHGEPIPSDWDTADAHWMIGLWWTSLLLGNGFARAASRVLGETPSIRDVHTYVGLSISGDFVTLVAAACIIAIIRILTDAHESSAAAFSRNAP